jgi:Fe2+ transport system protein FeoA
MQLVSTVLTPERVDYTRILEDTVLKMQSSVKRGAHKSHAANLTELKRGESAILESIDLDEYEARRLMEMGFLPGHRVTASHAAPGGDPRVFQIDGSEVALRRETARHLLLRKTRP